MYLLHNCRIKIRKSCKLTNEFISSVKNIMIRNNKYDSFISEISKPPNVTVTRRNTWLEAAIWYYNHFEKIKLYFCNLLSNDENFKSVRLMMILNNDRLYDKLKIIHNNYSNLCGVIKHT